MPTPDNLFVGRYQLLKPAGHGGMAAVFLAKDVKTGNKVALKILSSQPVTSEEYRARLRQEAKMLAKLNHPNIVRILDYGEVRGRPCLILEWVGGGTLASRMGHPIPYQEAASLLLPIARALQYAHEQGIIHRDVKPSNVLLSENSDPRLTDFGISKSLLQPGGMTTPGTGMGTPEYMAPEQALGQPVDARTDVYSLGVIYFELITGVKPFIGDTPLGTMLQASTKPLPRAGDMVPDLPEDVDRFLHKALAKDPSERFSSMVEFGSLLEKLADGKKLTLKEAPALPNLERTAVRVKLPKPKSKMVLPRWALPAGIAALALAAILVVWGAIFQFKLPTAPTGSRLGNLSDIQGIVQIDDGESTKAARRGSLLARTAHTILKTEDGTVRLVMADGATVILGQQSAIGFTQDLSSPSPQAVDLSLSYGRILVANNTKKDLPPVVLKIGSDTTVTGDQAVIGLESQAVGSYPQDIDCLVGTCTVLSAGKTTQLTAGQHIQIGKGGITLLSGASRNANWIALGNNLVPTPPATATLPPSATAIVVIAPSSTTLPPTSAFTATPLPSATRRASATFTITVSPTLTLTPTPTETATLVPTRVRPSRTATETEPPPPPPEPTSPPPPTAVPTNPPPPPPTDTPFPTYTPETPPP